MKLIFATTAALVALLTLGCSKSDNGGTNGKGDQGHAWMLQSWNGSTELEGTVYLALDNGSFALYQLVNTLGYQRFLGSYAISEGIFSGTYSDGKSFANTYEISGQDSKKMTLKSVQTQVVSIYVQTKIPSYVLDGVAISAQRAEAGNVAVGDDFRFL